MKVRKVLILEGAHDTNASGGGGMYWPAILNPFSMMYSIDVGYRLLFQVINLVHAPLE